MEMEEEIKGSLVGSQDILSVSSSSSQSSTSGSVSPNFRPLRNGLNQGAFNTALQALVRIPSFTAEILSHKHKVDSAEDSKCPRCIMKELVGQLMDFTQTDSVNPLSLLDVLKDPDLESSDPCEIVERLIGLLGVGCFSFETTEQVNCMNCQVSQPAQPAIIQNKLQLDFSAKDVNGQMTNLLLPDYIASHFILQQLERFACCNKKESCKSKDGIKRIHMSSTPRSLIIQLQNKRRIDNAQIPHVIQIPSPKPNVMEYYKLRSVICHAILTDTTSDPQFSCFGMMEKGGNRFVEIFNNDEPSRVRTTVDGQRAYLLFFDRISQEEAYGAINSDTLAFVQMYSDYIHNRQVMSSKLLVMLLPKNGDVVEVFKDLYPKCLKRDAKKGKKKKILYTISWEGAHFLRKLEQDPVVQAEYTVFSTKLLNHVNNANLWFAECALAYIIHSQIKKEETVFEFIFDQNPSSAVTANIMRYWDEILVNSFDWVTALACMEDQNLFCSNRSCSGMPCNFIFHWNLNEMKKRKMPETTLSESNLESFRFVGKNVDEDALLGKLLQFPVPNLKTTTVVNHIRDHLELCDSRQQCPYYVYMIVVVNPHSEKDRKRPPLLLWDEKTADFGVYVGITKHGPFRKAHLLRPEHGGTTSVSKFLTPISQFYNPVSIKVNTFKEVARLEAQGIGSLMISDIKLQKDGSRDKFTVLNKVLPSIPLFESNTEQRKEFEDFIRTNETLFQFLKKEQKGKVDCLLQSHYVDPGKGLDLVTDVDAETKVDDTSTSASQNSKAVNMDVVAGPSEATIQRYACDKCEKSYTDKSNLRRHRRKVHGTTSKLDSTSSSPTSTVVTSDVVDGPSEATIQRYACDKCEKSYTDKSNLRRHRRKVHGTTSKLDSTSSSPTSTVVTSDVVDGPSEAIILPYECDKCDKSYTFKRGLRRHQRKVHGTTPKLDSTSSSSSPTSTVVTTDVVAGPSEATIPRYECDKCEKSYTDKSSLRRHRRKLHSTTTKLAPKTAITRSTPRHKCDKCGKTFSERDSLMRHLRRVHSGIKRFICEKCGIAFRDGYALRQHVLRKHSGSEPIAVGTSQFVGVIASSETQPTNASGTSEIPTLNLPHTTKESNTNEKKDKKSFQCKICGRKYMSRRYLTCHIRRMHYANKKYKCETCNKGFMGRGKFTEHLRIHTGEKPFKCETCGRAFTAISNYNAHLRLHTGIKRFICEKCGKAFSYRSNLRQHVLRKHSGSEPMDVGTSQNVGVTASETHSTKESMASHEPTLNLPHTTKQSNTNEKKDQKSFQCKICGRKYVLRSYLNRHIKRMHSADKKYKCETCNKGFYSSYEFREHVRSHTGERPYKCETCGKAFAVNSNYHEHLRLHTGEKPFKCETCGKAFAANTKYREHVRIHTGEKPYKCKTCGKAFAAKCNYREHLRIHTGEKPFKCETCGKAYADRSSLRKHKLKHNQHIAT